MKRYLLIVGFILGQFLLIWHMASAPALIISLLSYWQAQRVEDYPEVRSYSGPIDVGTLSYDSSTKSFVYTIKSGQWTQLSGVAECKKYDSKGDLVACSNGEGEIVYWSITPPVEDGWPNSKDCPFDKEKQANVCK